MPTRASSFIMDAARHKLVGKLVRRHAFDFDAASSTFREHLKNEGVDFTPEATSAAALRKVFASLDRKKTSTLLPPSSDGDSSRLGGDGDHTPNASNAQQINDDGTTLALNTLHVNATKDEVHKISVPERKDRHKAEPREPTILPRSPGVANNSRTVPWSPTSTTEPVWDFESLLEEQRRREMQYDDQKEKIFEKVLSALGSHSQDSGAMELPSDIIQAWGARKEKLAAEATNVQNRNQKLAEDRSLALQRLALKQRHLPGSADGVGEDPLGLVVSGNTPTAQGQERGEGGLSFHPSRDHQDQAPSKAPVRLELGMQPEVLDKLLDELEEEAALLGAGGFAETNSELSQVIDELDKAAGDNPAATAILLGGVQQEVGKFASD